MSPLAGESVEQMIFTSGAEGSQTLGIVTLLVILTLSPTWLRLRQFERRRDIL